LFTYSVVLPVVGSGEEDVVEPESGIHQGDLDPVLSWGRKRLKNEARNQHAMNGTAGIVTRSRLCTICRPQGYQ